MDLGARITALPHIAAMCFCHASLALQRPIAQLQFSHCAGSAAGPNKSNILFVYMPCAQVVLSAVRLRSMVAHVRQTTASTARHAIAMPFATQCRRIVGKRYRTCRLSPADQLKTNMKERGAAAS